ncbi:hypothetical protein GCM10009753_49740 [Streptantibioticus ferralitis]
MSPPVMCWTRPPTEGTPDAPTHRTPAQTEVRGEGIIRIEGDEAVSTAPARCFLGGMGRHLKDKMPRATWREPLRTLSDMCQMIQIN